MFIVESIGKRRVEGRFKSFVSRVKAEDFARREVAKGKGILINSQRTILQRNFERNLGSFDNFCKGGFGF